MSLNSRAAFVCVLALLILPASSAAQQWDKWRPIEAETLALKAPTVEKDADAEGIFWEVWVHDQWDGYKLNNILQHYIRIKIFNERGRDAQTKIDLTYNDKSRVSDIAGRTLKSNGSIVELKKDGVFERTIAKASGVKVKAKSFVLPSVEPGDVIEYRWRETRSENSANYMRLHFQRDIPIQLVKYDIKPLSTELIPYQMRSATFHGKNTPFKSEINGFWSTTMSNMSAFREEAYMPPEDEVRAWMLIYYTEDKKLDAEKYWKEVGKDVYKKAKSQTKANDEIQRKAASLIGTVSEPEAKLAQLFDFCRTQIKNIYDDASGITADDRAKLKENKSASDTLKSGKGDGDDITHLFIALATAAGFEARIALLPDRGDTFFDPRFADSYFLRSRSVAVKVGEKWQFFDPASRFVPMGMLRWQEEGVPALVCDAKDPIFVTTELSEPAKSAKKRTATFRLVEDGTLEGDVQVESTGHFAAAFKEANDAKSTSQREEELRENIKERLSTAELSNIVLEDAADPLKPYTISYHIRVPGYAVRTGKRLFLQPAYFQRGFAPYFSTASRKHDLYFDYPWSEKDSIRFELPDGFVLDSGDAPAGIPGDIGSYEVKMSLVNGQRILTFDRTFHFGGKSTLFLPVGGYSQLKSFFDGVHEGDNHTITLKMSEGIQTSKRTN